MITLKSHGFKYSRPDANYYFDVSYFVNPWREEPIRQQKDPTRRRKMILRHMQLQSKCEDFVNSTTMLLRTVNKLFPDENIKVAFCCSAGEYRSPAIVELVGDELKKLKIPFAIEHSKESKL